MAHMLLFSFSKSTRKKYLAASGDDLKGSPGAAVGSGTLGKPMETSIPEQMTLQSIAAA